MLALSWSGGKDSTLALEALIESGRAPDLLFSTVDLEQEAIPHHATPLDLLRRQVDAIGFPLVEIEIPAESANLTYEESMRRAFAGPLAEVSEVAFGDLFLTDLRAYRESRLAAVGRVASFPLWGKATEAVSSDFARRFTATVCSVDLEQIPDCRPGVRYDAEFLRSLPEGADPSGERGEFHTFVHDGPVFARPVGFTIEGTTESADGRFLHARMSGESPPAAGIG